MKEKKMMKKLKQISILLSFTLALVIVMGLPKPVLAVIPCESGICIFSGYGTPSINGTLTPGEWDNATAQSFITSGGVPCELYVMNDTVNIYFAIRTLDDDLSLGSVENDKVWLYFDNDSDGVGPESGDDIFGWNGYYDPDVFKDGYSDGNYVWNFDTTDGGTADGAAAATNDETYNYFEISHPLDTSDDAHDFSLSLNDTVGIGVRLTVDSFDKGWWPSSDPESWASIVLADPVAYYPFNGNADDASGNGNNGTVSEAILTNDKDGNLDSAYSFDGLDDHIAVANSPSLSLNNFQNGYTIAAWIKPAFFHSGDPYYQVITAKGEGAFQLRLNLNQLEACHRFSGGTACGVYAGTDLSVDVWYHVAVTWDNLTNTWVLYLDGAARSFSVDDLASTDDGNIKIGQRARETPQEKWNFNGVIDEVYLFDRALSQEEIGQLSDLSSDPCAAQGGDTDGDTICNPTDNCPLVANYSQNDFDNDNFGDACDDSDGDGLVDADEFIYSTDPGDPDTDDDGLSDGDEIFYETNPNNNDTDGDKMSDGWEVNEGTNPNNINEYPAIPIDFSIMNVRQHDENNLDLDTYIEVMVQSIYFEDVGWFEPFTGTLPDDIDSIQIVGDSSDIIAEYPSTPPSPDWVYYPSWKEFWISLPGPPADDLYTATVTSGSLTGTDTDVQEFTRPPLPLLPLFDTTYFSPTNGGNLKPDNLTFSWPLLDPNPGIPLHYRLVINYPPGEGGRIFANEYPQIQDKTTHTLDPGSLPPGLYRYHIRVYDNEQWVPTNNRVNGPWIYFTVGIDNDNDQVRDIDEKCPNDPYNDVDKDDICGDVDNCPKDANSDQVDLDQDGVGDVCDNCLKAPNGPQGGTWVCYDYTNTDDQGLKISQGGVCPGTDPDPNIPCDGPDRYWACSQNQEDIDNDGDGDACDIADLVGSQVGLTSTCELIVPGVPNDPSDAFYALNPKFFLGVVLENEKGEKLSVKHFDNRALKIKKECNDTNNDGIVDEVKYITANSDVVEIDPPYREGFEIDLTDERFDPAEIAAAESLTATCYLIQTEVDPNCDPNAPGYDADCCPSDPQEQLQPIVLWSQPFTVAVESVTEVDIDIIPKDDNNKIFLKEECDDDDIPDSQGPQATVAIFGSSEFDVRQIILETLHFAGASLRLLPNGKLHIDYKDQNEDGIEDLIAKFNVWDTDIKLGDTEAKVDGEAYVSGEKIIFYGVDAITVVPCKE